MNIHKINLNLLVIFDTLMLERNVTKAACRIGITQPAMSNALKNLRQLFADELFVRGPKAMLPTPKALELSEPIHEITQKAKTIILSKQTFTPKQSTKTFVLGMSDYVEFLLLKPLMQHLHREAPTVRLQIKHINYLSDSSLLDDRKLELAIGFFQEAPEKLIRQKLFDDELVCAGWKKNPLLRKNITSNQFINAPQIRTQFREIPLKKKIDSIMAKIINRNNIIVTGSHILTAMFMLPETEYLSVTPSLIVERLGSKIDITKQKLPQKNQYKVDIHQLWHPQLHNDPAHKWLRKTIKNIANSL